MVRAILKKNLYETRVLTEAIEKEVTGTEGLFHSYRVRRKLVQQTLYCLYVAKRYVLKEMDAMVGEARLPLIA